MKQNLYNIVTDKIIAQLEKGVVPWKKGWVGGDLPKNFITKKPYRGVNVWLLAMNDFSSEYWLTFNQCRKKGGSVKKGEKSTMVIFWNFIEVKDKDDEDEVKKIPMLRYYNVFNVEQCEGLPVPKEEASKEKIEPLAVCEKVVAEYKGKPAILGATSPQYKPLSDTIGMPNKDKFLSAIEYYAALFHEMTHSTGHKSRLNREGVVGVASFGSETYSKEELVAEMGATFLHHHTGINPKKAFENNAAYIGHWLGVLKSDNKLIVQASGQAQRAVDHILGITFDENNS